MARPIVALLLLASMAGCLAPSGLKEQGAAGQAADPDDGLTTLGIQVIDALQGQGVSRAAVAVGVPGIGTVHKVADDDGRTSVTIRPVRTCTVQASREGYQEAKATTECLSDREIRIALKPKAAAPEPPGPGPAAPAPPPTPVSNQTNATSPTSADARPHVVVATFDTGLNPFHPAWRSARDPRLDLALPADAVEISLSLGADFGADWAASSTAWASTQGTDALLVFNGTRLLGVADAGDPTAYFDRAGDAHSHGARASSQVSATGYGIADHAYVVGLDMIGGTVDNEPFVRAWAPWVAQQQWIDVVHINFGFPAPWPAPLGLTAAVQTLVESGKLVVLPALNGAGNGGPPYPMEFGQLTHVPGSLVAGANDQCAAGSYWSNLNPHVVMDGEGTTSIASIGYGEDSFGGTSSASPRIAGYAAEVLYQVRLALNLSEGMRDRALVVVPADRLPASGPLADGHLDAHELHEAIRKTARPAHDSWMDGYGLVDPCPAFPEAGANDYAKVGYGEVSDATLGDTVAVLLGTMPMPVRSEDSSYEASENLRHQISG